jgi:signal transduction histidine kinase
MSEEEYRAAVQKQGAHSFVVVLSTMPLRAAAGRDLWLRCVIAMLAAVSVTAVGWAYRNVVRSSELEVRLVRAAELNTRLKEMSLAAAGLAHETKNPLNIIRGLAQMISRREDASAEIRGKTREILDMSDRVTAQLNEFINYSRPREVRRAAVALDAVVGEVVRALAFDLEDKRIALHTAPGLPVIEADEQLLRQTLFNLLLNAIQAVEPGGRIEVGAGRTPAGRGVLEIKDDGPGVPAEHRADIFKPYYTTHQKGTGLGLAVVQQIATAHGWEIECLANEPRGACFRLSHLALAETR